MKNLTLWILVVGTLSCRIANVGKDVATDQTPVSGGDVSAKPPIVQPQRSEAASGVSQAIPVHLGENGAVTQKILLRLDYFAAPKPGGITVPTCYESIAGQLVVGRIECGSKPELRSDVTADQMDQVCYTESTTPKVTAKSTAVVPGCSGPSTLQIYTFAPEMKVELK